MKLGIELFLEKYVKSRFYPDEKYKNELVSDFDMTLGQIRIMDEKARFNALVILLTLPKVAQERLRNYGSLFSDEYSTKKETDERYALATSKAFDVLKKLLNIPFKEDAITQEVLSLAWSPEVLKMMLSAGISPNAKSQQGALISLLSQGSPWDPWPTKDLGPKIEMTKTLLEAGAKLYLVDDNGFYAIWWIEPKIIEVLLGAGVEIPANDKAGSNVLHALLDRDKFWGDESEYLPKFRKLLGLKKEDFNRQNDEGDTPIGLLLKKAEFNQETMEFASKLVSYGSSVGMPPFKYNVLEYLALAPNEEYRYPPEKEAVEKFVVKVLKKSPELVLTKNSKTGDYPLNFHAAGSMHYSRSICEVLIRQGADVDGRNNLGMTPLLCAARAHAFNTWALLISKRSNIQAKADSGDNLYDMVVSDGKVPPAKFLDVLLKTKLLFAGNVENNKLLSGNTLLAFLIVKGEFLYAQRFVESGCVIDDEVVNAYQRYINVFDIADESNLSDFIASIGQLGIDCYVAKDSEVVSRNLLMASSSLTSDLSALEKWSLDQLLSTAVWETRAGDAALSIRVDTNTVLPSVSTIAISRLASLRARDVEGISGGKLKAPLEAACKSNAKNSHFALSQVSQLDQNEFVDLWNESAVQLYEGSTHHASNKMGAHYPAQSYVDAADDVADFVLTLGPRILPGFVMLLRKKPTVSLLQLCMAIDSLDLVSIMIQKLNSGGMASRVARSWLLEYSGTACRALVPLALGKKGAEKSAAQAALRWLNQKVAEASRLIFEVAGHCSEDYVVAIKKILAVNPLYDYSKRLPAELTKLYVWLETVSKKQFQVRTLDGRILSHSEVTGLLRLLAASTTDDPCPLLAVLKPKLDQEDLEELGLDLFFCFAGHSSDSEGIKRSDVEWCAVGIALFGGAKTIAKLRPLIKTWPRGGGMYLSIRALRAFSSIGSDAAISALNSTLITTTYKPLIELSDELMGGAAAARSLTKDQLVDRLTPDLGLDVNGERVFDYGVNKYILTIEANLKPVLKFDGKQIKGIPIAKKGDDKQASASNREDIAGIIDGLKIESKQQLQRFEKSMMTGKLWAEDDFKKFVAEHPLLMKMAATLVWSAGEGQFFRITDGGDWLDVSSKPLKIEPGCHVSLPHPILLGKQLPQWLAAFKALGIKQSVDQLTRSVYSKKDAGADNFGIDGGTAPASALRGLRSKGWTMSTEVSSLVGSLHKKLSSGNKCDIHLETGFFISVYESDKKWGHEKQVLDVTFPKNIEAVEYSELIRELKNVLY